MIRTWIADVSPLLQQEVYEHYYKEVPRFRQEKADRIRFPKDKALSVGAWVLLERMRMEYALGEEAVFNLSHSGEFALCAIDDSQVQDTKLGCDIEMVKEVRLEIASRFFCAGETEYIKGRLTKEEQASAFYRYWVLKESFMKATRLGMRLDMGSFEIGFGRDDIPVLIRQPEEIVEEYFYKEYAVRGVEGKIAVCSTCREFDEIRKVVLGTG